MKLLLVGAGGHAKAVYLALRAAGHELVGYVAPQQCDWLDRPWLGADADVMMKEPDAGFALGLGGVAPEQLNRRLVLFELYRSAGRTAPPIVHLAATIADANALSDGVVVLAGAIVQPGASIGRGAIVNTGAIVEHDAKVGAGVHLAPGAMALGGVRIGDAAMIGAGAVVLPGATVPAGALIAALTRFP